MASVINIATTLSPMSTWVSFLTMLQHAKYVVIPSLANLMQPRGT